MAEVFDPEAANKARIYLLDALVMLKYAKRNSQGDAARAYDIAIRDAESALMWVVAALRHDA
jgi:hypothetical protein